MASSLYSSPSLLSPRAKRSQSNYSSLCAAHLGDKQWSTFYAPCLNHTPVVALIEQRGCLSRSDCHPRGCVWRRLGEKQAATSCYLEQVLVFRWSICQLSVELCVGVCVRTNWTSTLWSISSEPPICILRLFVLGLSPPLCLYKEVHACVYVCDWLPTGSSLLMIALAISLWGSPPMTNSHIRYQPPLFHKINSLSSVFSAYIGWCCCSFLFSCIHTMLWIPTVGADRQPLKPQNTMTLYGDC